MNWTLSRPLDYASFPFMETSWILFVVIDLQGDCAFLVSIAFKLQFVLRSDASMMRVLFDA